MILDATLVLDALCLAIYSNDIETESILKNILDINRNAPKKEAMFEDDLCPLYLDIIQDIVENELDVDNDAELAVLMLKFESHASVREDSSALIKLQKVVDNRKRISPGRIKTLKTRLRKLLMVIQGNTHLKNMFRDSTKLVNSVDPNVQDTIFSELISNARELVHTLETRSHHQSTTIDRIDMSDPTSLTKGLQLFKHKRANDGYKLGFQQFAKMFGENLGPVPGQFIAFAAPSHHFKTGMLLSFARWLVTLNIPKKQTDKPAAIIFISLENEIHENMMMWFKEAYYHEFHKNPVGLSDGDIVQAIIDLFSKKKVKLIVYREDGDSFGWEEWKELHERESLDYEILASITDYLGLMKVPEDSNRADKRLQNLASNMKNYGARNAMITATGLQLNGAAEELAANGQNVVRKFTAAHLADCKSIKKELDVLIFMFIEMNHLGERYLTCWLDKLRYNKMPTVLDRYMAIKFTEHGLMDDIYGTNSSVPDIYNITSNTPDGRADVNAVF